VKLRETLAKLDRLQQTRGFKITATIVVAAIALTAAIGYAVLVTGPAKDALDERYSFLEDFDEDGRPRPEVDLDAETSSEFDQEQATGEEELELEAFESARQSAVVEAQRITAGLLRARLNPWNVFIAAGAVGAVFIAAIWLGLGLTYVGVNLALAIVVTPLALFSATQGVAVLIGGAGQLALAFATLLRVAAISLGGSTPVTAVARTVLTEAVRMKLSGVFIVLLVFGLAGLPALLDPQEELRYRVQSFLQYAMGGTYVLVAMLTLFFSVATVAFEQRDKIIWQTMTKPVGAWQYVLGKWLGIVTLNACLLGVCGAGIFMFTEYLRAQPAIGERVAYDSGAAGPISEDRLILETRVLTARRVVGATPPVLPDDPDHKPFFTINGKAAESFNGVQVEIKTEQSIATAWNVTPQDAPDDIRDRLSRPYRYAYGATLVHPNMRGVAEIRYYWPIEGDRLDDQSYARLLAAGVIPDGLHITANGSVIDKTLAPMLNSRYLTIDHRATEGDRGLVQLDNKWYVVFPLRFQAEGTKALQAFWSLDKLYGGKP